MAGEAPESGSLRDVISQAVDEQEKAAPAPDAPAPAAAEPAAAVSSEATKDERPRDPATGQFLPKAESAKAAEPKPETPAPSAVQAAPKPHPTRPSSWKKDYWDDWGKLDPRVADYILSRENDYAKGVSTYKTEFDQLKPLQQAVGQFAQEIQRLGIRPEQFVTNLGNAHRSLLTGTPEQKLSMFMKLAQDYQVPVQALFTRGQDGQIYFNPQVQAYQPPQQQQQPADVRSTVQEILSQERAQQQLAEFEREVAAGKYEHYEAVKPTMAQLLEAGMSSTLQEAYDDALRQRQHADLFAQVQQAEAEKKAKEAAQKAAEEAARARRNNVSPRSSTPAVKSGDGKPRTVRESIEASVEAHSEAGRF